MFIEHIRQYRRRIICNKCDKVYLSTFMVNGFIFRCNEKTFQECLDRNLFGELEDYLPLIKQLEVGSSLFLYNTSNWNLYGIFEAVGKGQKYIEASAWGGRFPAQIRVKVIDKVESIHIDKAKSILKFKGIYPDPILSPENIKKLVELFN